MQRAILIFLSLILGGSVNADDGAVATYLANQGVMIESGGVAVLFDPLFDRDFDQFQRVPADMQAALLEGEAPFDNVAAVFVSHYHGDHFSPELMLDYLRGQPEVRLYGPVQATRALRQVAGDEAEVHSRITGLELTHGDAPVALQIGDLAVSAVRLPHSGWPDRMTDIENLAFRVTLNDQIIVEHYGDADAKRQHFESNAAYWDAAQPDFSMPPYWFFLSPEGREVITEVIRAERVIGTHVPVELPPYPAVNAPEFRAYDLFRVPGEQRPVP